MTHLCPDMLAGMRVLYHVKAGAWVLRTGGPGVERISLVIHHCPWCGMRLS